MAERIQIYHYNRCSKSRTALALLKEKESEFEIRNYMEEALSVADLKELLKKLACKAEDLVRKNESLFKEKYSDENPTEEEWLRILVENPRLIQRPIVIRGNRAVIARPPERIQELF